MLPRFVLVFGIKESFLRSIIIELDLPTLLSFLSKLGALCMDMRAISLVMPDFDIVIYLLNISFCASRRSFISWLCSCLLLNSSWSMIGSNSLGVHMKQLNIEIWMAKVETINDITTVVSEWLISLWSTNINNKWIRYYGPSCVARVQIPIVLPNVIGFLQISMLFCMQKESKTVATSIFSLIKLNLQHLSIFGSVCLKSWWIVRRVNRAYSG